MIRTRINHRWDLWLPPHRAMRPEWGSGWETERLASMYEQLPKEATIIDVGAEEGDLSALYAAWGADVVLFEPNPAVWPNIRAIFEANQLSYKVKGWFVGFASSESNLTPAEYDAAVATVRGGWPECAYGRLIGDHGFRQLNERPHDTPQVRLDDYCAEQMIIPSALTIDVEGSELHVLQGAEKLLTNARPKVWVSIHPQFMMTQYGTSPGKLHEYMLSLGYHAQHLATDHEEHWLFEPDQ